MEEVLLAYIEYSLRIKNDPNLGEQIRSQILLQMAQSLNYLVPLANGSTDVMLQQQQAVDKHNQELQMAQEKHQADLEMQQQKHQVAMAIQQQKASQTNNKPQTK